MATVHHVLEGLDSTQQWQERLYVHLHQNPELSMQETETAVEVSRRLEAGGYTVHQVGGGVVGVLANGEGRTVLVRADMDALPVQEATGLPYASTRTAVDADGRTVPVMHACGHDLHVACGLGAAELMARNREAWTGTYIALFQPGEETAAGARAMVADGLVDRVPTPDVAPSTS
jgi:hippurate hydrolase